MEYFVKDLAVATFLAYKKIKIVKPYDVKTQSWVFESADGKCEEYELEVRNGVATVSVSEYESIRRNLLGMVPRGSSQKH